MRNWVYRRPSFRPFLRRAFNLRLPVQTVEIGRVEFEADIVSGICMSTAVIAGICMSVSLGRGICMGADVSGGILMGTDIISGVSTTTEIF